MNVKVASDDKFMRCGSSKREEGMEVLKKQSLVYKVKMMKEDGKCYKQIFWNEKAGELW